MYNSDVNQTFEGDNYVLLQQTARMILKNVVWLHKGKPLLETMEYLTMTDPEKHHFQVELDAKVLAKLFQIRAKDKAIECAMALNGKPSSEFNKQQPYSVREMCESYHQLYLIHSFEKFFKQAHCEKTKAVFHKLFMLYMITKILKDGDYFRNWLSSDQIKKLKEDSLSLLE